MDNVAVVYRLDGRKERVQTERVSVHVETVIRAIWRQKVAPTDASSRVFAILQGFLSDPPPWLRAVEVARYKTLFREFATFSVRSNFRDLPTEALPVSDLQRASYQWLESLSRDADPLLMSHGLDAIDFLFALIDGKRDFEQNVVLDPIVEIAPEIFRSSTFDDRGLRKDYTQNVLGRLPVLARVPFDGSIKDKNGIVVVDGGEEFGIQIVRCHMSQDPPYEFEGLHVRWNRLQPYDRAIDFSFKARLLMTEDVTTNTRRRWKLGEELSWFGEGPLMRVPADWIFALLVPNGESRGARPEPTRLWIETPLRT